MEEVERCGGKRSGAVAGDDAMSSTTDDEEQLADGAAF